MSPEQEQNGSAPSPLSRLLTRLNAGERGRQMAVSALWTFALRIFTILATFGISILLSRTLRASGYGVYAYAIGWVQVLALPGLLGMERLVVRHAAAYRQSGEWGLLRGLMRWALLMTAGMSLLLAGGGVVLVLALGKSTPLLHGLVYGLPLLPLLVLVRLLASGIHGQGRVALSQVPENLVHPLLLILLIGSAALFLPDRFSPILALGCYGIAMAVALLAGAISLRIHLPREYRQSKALYQRKLWGASVAPLLFIGAMQTTSARADLLILGALMGSEAAGIYTVATRGASLILLATFAVNAALAPTLAGLHAQGNHSGMQDLVTKAARVNFIGALPLAVGLILFAKPLLSLFGPEFPAGSGAMILLALANLAGAWFGPATTLLVMSGHEVDAARAFAVGTGITVIGDFVFIPLLGLQGAAVVMLVSTVVWSLLLVRAAKRRLGVVPAAWPVSRRRSDEDG